MPLPPRGNPRRPLHLAIRSTRLLGIIFLCFGTLAMLPTMLLIGRGGGMGLSLLILLFVSSLFYLGPGILYLICSIYLKQRKSWAVVVAIALASLQLLIIVMASFAYVSLLFSEELSGWMIAPGVMILAFLLALAQLIYHLAKSFEAIKYPPDDQRGFEPLMVQPMATLRPEPFVPSPTPSENQIP